MSELPVGRDVVLGGTPLVGAEIRPDGEPLAAPVLPATPLKPRGRHR